MSFADQVAAGVLLLGMCALSGAQTPIDTGIDIQIDRSHQSFASANGGDESADITTVGVMPYLQFGHWEFSLDLPWTAAEGNFFNANFPPRLLSTCDAASSDRARRFVQNYPRSNLAKNILRVQSQCAALGVNDADDDVEGLGDITAFARYGAPLDARGIWLLSLGAGYKFDNGDVDENLGSGTRNTLFEASLGANYRALSATLTGGYVHVSGGDEEIEAQYRYAALDLGLSPRDWMTLGCTFDYDESYVVTAADVTTVTAYVKFRPWRHTRFKLYARDYGDESGYPEREYGGTLSFVY